MISFENEIINLFKKKFKLNNKIFLHEPGFSKSDFLSLCKSLKSTHVSSSGIFTNIFENKLREFTKSKFVISTINGTSALHSILKIIGTNPKDEVLVPALTFVGTANAIKYCGATPNFVDVEEKTFGIDPKKLEKYLSKNCNIKKNFSINKKTKKVIRALICVHVFGNPCRIIEIKKILKKYKIILIEDAAEGIGSYYMQKHLGTFGDFGILSFNGNKTITTGGGGAILLKKRKYFNKLIKLVSTGKEKHAYEYFYKTLGYNYRMPSLNASLGISQLKTLSLILKKKENVFKFYKKLFSKVSGLKLHNPTKHSKSNYWLNTIILDENKKKFKNSIIKGLIKNNLYCRPLWYPLHKLNYFRNSPKDNLECSENLYKRCINIPSSANLLDSLKLKIK